MQPANVQICWFAGEHLSVLMKSAEWRLRWPCLTFFPRTPARPQRQDSVPWTLAPQNIPSLLMCSAGPLPPCLPPCSAPPPETFELFFLCLFLPFLPDDLSKLPAAAYPGPLNLFIFKKIIRYCQFSGLVTFRFIFLLVQGNEQVFWAVKKSKAPTWPKTNDWYILEEEILLPVNMQFPLFRNLASGRWHS